MKRETVEDLIKYHLLESTNHLSVIDNYDEATKRLTDLFIQLSEELCQDQRKICYNTMLKNYGQGNLNKYASVLNAPLPTLD